MPESVPSQKWQKIANEAGFSGALSLYAHLTAIHWIGIPNPGELIVAALVPAGATILAGTGRAAAWAYRNWFKKGTTHA